MRWQYLRPRHYEFITNGKTLWFYQPEQKQVTVGDAQQVFKNGVGGSFLSDFSLVRDRNTSILKAVNATTLVVELIPKRQNPEVKLMQILIDKGAFDIIAVTTWNQQNDTTRFEFSKIYFGDSHPAMYEFHPPGDITVIQGNEQLIK
jgi:outer membrane lipoprotein carrier protein